MTLVLLANQDCDVWGMTKQVQKEIWKRELDEANRTAEKCGNVRMVETMFDRNPVRRMESAGELLNGWKQEYRKML